MGLDIGDRRIGVALSDQTGVLASPLTILERRDEEKDIEAIINIIGQHQVKQVVIGLPRSMDGSIGTQAKKVQAFVEKLSGRTEVPVVLRDERLTSVSARRLIQAAKVKKSKKKIPDDAVAAALILQSYLDESLTLSPNK